MIRIYIPGLYESDFSSHKDMRLGDCQVVDDGFNYVIIDGYCGVATKRFIERLKRLDIKTPFLVLTHPHYDHYYGIQKIIEDTYFSPKGLLCQNPDSIDSNFSKDCANNVKALRQIISKAKARNIPVEYISNGRKITYGEIDMEFYRIQPKTAENTDAYLNDGSLCVWFPKLRYLTTGDGPDEIYELCKINKLKPVFFKIPHHGNNCNRPQSNGLASLGAKYCWDNDYSETITDFLSTGRKRCIEAGIKYINCHGDINVIAYAGKTVIYKGAEHWSYACDYVGDIALRSPDLAIVKSVLKGTLGNGDTRITNLLDLQYRPAGVQSEVNALIKLIRG